MHIRYPVAALAMAAVCLDTGTATAMQEPPPRTCAGEGFGGFDFWLGSWSVHDLRRDGKLVGHNEIRKLPGGCALFESWEAVSGGVGHSLNFYDPDSGLWRQLWVAPPGYGIDIAGRPDDAGRLLLEGEIHYFGGDTLPFRGLWTPHADGTVRQTFEQYDPETASWNIWFDGLYRPAAAED